VEVRLRILDEVLRPGTLGCGGSRPAWRCAWLGSRHAESAIAPASPARGSVMQCTREHGDHRHKTMAEVERYTKTVAQKRLAQSAIDDLSSAGKGNPKIGRAEALRRSMLALIDGRRGRSSTVAVMFAMLGSSGVWFRSGSGPDRVKNLPSRPCRDVPKAAEQDDRARAPVTLPLRKKADIGRYRSSGLRFADWQRVKTHQRRNTQAR